MTRFVLLLGMAGAALAPQVSGARARSSPALTRQQADFVESKVRPVLVENCVGCHGPRKQMGGLRLDSRAALLKGSDNGPVVQPGDPDNSLLIQAIRRHGPVKMPPRQRLKPEAVEALETWVRMGAPWPAAAVVSIAGTAGKQHWAFQEVRDPAPPRVQHRDWPRTSVDPFILARLETRGLTPAPEADRRTLLRRVTFDLLGLPPTPEEVEAFVRDPAPDAYERVVERLLASPHYGERWGRYWLDVARYADTKGYVFFQESDFPWAYTYRDYVIRSLNQDLPYDRFVLEQLAADQLPLGADRRALTALGFLTVGGRFMNNVHDIIDDQIDVVMRGLQGLTVTCARCHDHKFDPIPQADYYSLYGVFASCLEPAEPPLFAEPPRTRAYAAFQKELAARERKLIEFVHAKHLQVTGAARTRAADYLLAAHALRGQPDTGEFMLLADGNDLNPTMITRWHAYLERTRREHHPVFVPWHAFAALPEKDFASRARELSAQFAAGREGPVNPLVARSFAARPPGTLAEAARRYGELLNEADHFWQEARKRAAQTGQAPPAALADPAREELRQVFYGDGAPPNVAESLFGDLALLPDRPAQAELQKLRKAVEEWRVHGTGAPPRAMVLVDAAVPHQAHIFLRGNPNNPGRAVPRQFLEVLGGPGRRPFRQGSGRLELARAIADRNNPLTARVFVNRMWLHHFGAGLVRTPGDLGLRGEAPTHPELLDHLASRFMDGGWSVKKLHRLIVLSSTYRQASGDRPEGQAADPENTLLWKMNRRRLDFEALRDALLAVSGRLDRKVGGPSVKEVVSPAARRRTMYGYIDRLHVPGLFRTFDFPSPDATSPQRDSTTVPQQALFLMNNPFVAECARGVLGRTAPGRNREQRVGQIYRLLYGREPSPEELRLARAFLGDGPRDAGVWERYARALLMTNEFAFVD